MQERVHAEFKVCGGVVVEEEIADAGECGERMCGEFLLEAVGAERVTLGVGCEGFEQDTAGVTVLLGDGRRERADLLIAAGLMSLAFLGFNGLGAV